MGEWLLSRRDRLILARHEVPLQFGHLQKVTSGNARHFDGRMAFVPEGQVDRSQVRSAWTAPSQKSRPVGYGLIRAGERTNSSDWMIGVTKLRKTKLKQLVLYYFYLAFLN